MLLALPLSLPSGATVMGWGGRVRPPRALIRGEGDRLAPFQRARAVLAARPVLPLRVRLQRPTYGPRMCPGWHPYRPFAAAQRVGGGPVAAMAMGARKRSACVPDSSMSWLEESISTEST